MIHFEQNLKRDLNVHSCAGKSQAFAGGVMPAVSLHNEHFGPQLMTEDGLGKRGVLLD